MDLITAGLGIVFLLSGFVAGRFSKKESKRVKNLESKIQEWKVTADKYKKIAATHDINLPQTSKARWIKRCDMKYSGSIENNLKRLKKDLSSCGDITLNVEFSENFIWGSDMRKFLASKGWSWTNSYNFKTSHELSLGIFQKEYTGKSEDIFEEISTNLKTKSAGLWDGRWITDYPITFQFKVYEWKKDEVTTVEPVYVEVLVTEPKDELIKDPDFLKAQSEVDRFLSLVKEVKVGQ